MHKGKKRLHRRTAKTNGRDTCLQEQETSECVIQVLKTVKKTYMKNLQNVLKYRHFILDITICKIYSAFIDDIDTFDDKC